MNATRIFVTYGLAMLILLGVAFSRSKAEVIRYTYTGQLTKIPGPSLDVANLNGALFSAVFLMDSAQLPSSTSSSSGVQFAEYQTFLLAEITFFGRPFGAADETLPVISDSRSRTLTLTNEFPPKGSPTDQLDFQMGQTSLAGRMLALGPVMDLIFADPEFFPGSALPTPPVFEEEDYLSASLVDFQYDANGDGLFSPIDAFYAVSDGRLIGQPAEDVPEPSALTLLLAAAVGLAILTKKTAGLASIFRCQKH